MVALLVLVFLVLVGLVCLGIGIYVFYVNLTQDDNEAFSGSPDNTNSAYVLGCLALMIGLALICIPLAFFFFGFNLIPIG